MSLSALLVYFGALLCCVCSHTQKKTTTNEFDRTQIEKAS